jgi:hypothetical protein
MSREQIAGLAKKVDRADTEYSWIKEGEKAKQQLWLLRNTECRQQGWVKKKARQRGCLGCAGNGGHEAATELLR